MLDEAIESVETTIDNLIQKKIREETNKCTVHSHLCILDVSTPYPNELLSKKPSETQAMQDFLRYVPVYVPKDRNRTSIEGMGANCFIR